ncbi:MAG: hypothetical protein A2030_10320 [Chloroflexi bacterium RBG_19FT_COMBO_50_10]|nr:MAG: hypothetical protein A2030_10320 [Chloroflexi bacterium RBG_19FT_COMBO_50_10]
MTACQNTRKDPGWQFTQKELYFSSMDDLIIKQIHRISALILLTAVLFYLFFEVNKRSLFVEANNFAADPYDEVG